MGNGQLLRVSVAVGRAKLRWFVGDRHRDSGHRLRGMKREGAIDWPKLLQLSHQLTTCFSFQNIWTVKYLIVTLYKRRSLSL